MERTKRNGNKMFKVHKKEIEVAGKKISLETGKVARQADGAIIATCGETVILATVVGAKKVNPDMDYSLYQSTTKKNIMQVERSLVDILKEKQDQLKVKH